MKRMVIKSLLASLALGALISGGATTIDYPFYHYRGYVGPGELEYHYSNQTAACAAVFFAKLETRHRALQRGSTSRSSACCDEWTTRSDKPCAGAGVRGIAMGTRISVARNPG